MSFACPAREPMPAQDSAGEVGAKNSIASPLGNAAGWRFRLDYEDSQRLEVLDGGGKPLAARPEKSRERAFSAVLALSGARAQGDWTLADGAVEEIRELRLPELPALEAERERGALKFALRIEAGKDARVEIEWKAAELARLRRLLKTPEAAVQWTSLLESALGDLLRLYPSAPRPATAGQKWSAAREHALLSGGALKTVTEIESVGEERTDPKRSPPGAAERRLLKIAGAVRQELPGAPPQIVRSPGLFPGSLTWLHDLDTGVPWLLEVEKPARVPVADERLPILKTLTHTYRLRAGAIEAFAGGKAGAE